MKETALIHKDACIIWDRAHGKDGRPLASEGGRQYDVARAAWLDLHGQNLVALDAALALMTPAELSRSGSPLSCHYLHRLCADIGCISPSHRILKNPEKIRTQLGVPAYRYNQLLKLVSSRFQKIDQFCFAGSLSELECHPAVVQQLGIRLSVMPALILAIYAKLARDAANDLCSG